MPPTQSKLSGKVLQSQSREIVSNERGWINNYSEEHRCGSSKGTTGVSESSVRRITRETKNIESGASTSFSTPHKERPRKPPLATLDDFNESVVLRTINDFYFNESVVLRTINDFYIVEKQRPTLKKVHEKLKKTLDFQGCISTLKDRKSVV
jgi:hypothetical protein